MSEKCLFTLPFSYLFMYHIESVWKIITTIETFLNIFCDEIDSFEFMKGNSFSKGSEFSYRWKCMLYVNMKIEELENQENYKMITFFCHNINPIDLEFRIVYHFYWNSVEETTFFIHEMICDDPDSLLIHDNQNKEIERILCKRIDKMLFEKNQNIKQSESLILNLNLEKTWSIITDWRIFKLFVPNIAEEIEYKGDPLKVNTEFMIKNKSNNNFNNLKVIKVEFPNKDNKMKNFSLKKAQFVLHCYFGYPRCPLQNLICMYFKIKKYF